MAYIKAVPDSVIITANFLVPFLNCYHYWKWLTLHLFISELLVTNQSVEHGTLIVKWCCDNAFWNWHWAWSRIVYPDLRSKGHGDFKIVCYLANFVHSLLIWQEVQMVRMEMLVPNFVHWPLESQWDREYYLWNIRV